MSSRDPHPPLANAPWCCLSGPHGAFAEGQGELRRYARGLAPIAAFRDPLAPDLERLLAFSDPGETLYLPGVVRAEHPAWEALHALRFTQMVRGEGAPAATDTGSIRLLGADDLPALQALLAMTDTTMFGPGMLAVGDHFGLFENGQLVSAGAMRLLCGRHREISTVCTRPGATGRGHASALVREIARRIEAAGQVPFLYVAQDDLRATGIYRRCGFEPVRVIPLLVVRRRAAAATATA
jgi:ribosomal protein S18 acetylase RimI-like enzyme